MYTDKVRFLIKHIETLAEDCADEDKSIPISKYEEIADFISDFDPDQIARTVNELVRIYSNMVYNHLCARREKTHFMNSCVNHCIWEKRF